MLKSELTTASLGLMGREPTSGNCKTTSGQQPSLRLEHTAIVVHKADLKTRELLLFTVSLCIFVSYSLVYSFKWFATINSNQKDNNELEL